MTDAETTLIHDVAVFILTHYGLPFLVASALLAVVLIRIGKLLGTRLTAAATARGSLPAQKELASHTEAERLNADARRLDFQRRLSEFQTLAAKRHDAYIRVYRRLVRAEGRTLAARGGILVVRPTYEDADRNNIEILLASPKLPGATRTHILSLWDDEATRPQAIKELHALQQRVELDAAYDSVRRARNDWILYALYLSPHVSDAVKAALDAMGAHVFTLQTEELRGRGVEMIQQEDKIRTLVAKATALMKQDLARADFEDSTTPAAISPSEPNSLKAQAPQRGFLQRLLPWTKAS